MGDVVIVRLIVLILNHGAHGEPAFLFLFDDADEFVFGAFADEVEGFVARCRRWASDAEEGENFLGEGFLGVGTLVGHEVFDFFKLGLVFVGIHMRDILDWRSLTCLGG